MISFRRSPGLVDVMAHVDDPRIEEPEAVWQRAHDAGVTIVINAGVDPLDVPERRWAQTSGVDVRFAYGLHPAAIDRFAVTAQLDALAERLAEPGVVAIGEVGLDAREDMPPPGLQERVLQTQLQLARHMKLPVILHCVHAIGRLVELLESEDELPAGAVMHGFGGPAEMIGRLSKRRCAFSFGGLVTRDNAKKCRAAARAVPDKLLLVESDAPDHPPQGHARSEPAGIVETLRVLAELRGSTVERLGDLTARNARRMFRLK